MGKIKFERGTGNVFADIGIPNPEQALAKAEIARRVNKIIEARRLTQSAAASILGIDQPRVSALSKGHLSVFSLEKLMLFASRLGNTVEISIKPSEDGGITVTDAEATGPPPRRIGRKKPSSPGRQPRPPVDAAKRATRS